MRRGGFVARGRTGTGTKKHHKKHDGEEGKEYERIVWDPVFSPDSKRVTYVVQRGSKRVVVVDGKEGKEYEGIMQNTPVFSSDSKRVAYTAFEGGWVVVVDGVEGKRYEWIVGPCFSPDCKRLAYFAKGDKWVVVVDGAEGKEEYKYSMKVSSLVFDGPDSFHGVAVKGDEFVRVEVRIVGR